MIEGVDPLKHPCDGLRPYRLMCRSPFCTLCPL